MQNLSLILKIIFLSSNFLTKGSIIGNRRASYSNNNNLNDVTHLYNMIHSANNRMSSGQKLWPVHFPGRDIPAATNRLASSNFLNTQQSNSANEEKETTGLRKKIISANTFEDLIETLKNSKQKNHRKLAERLVNLKNKKNDYSESDFRSQVIALKNQFVKKNAVLARKIRTIMMNLSSNIRSNAEAKLDESDGQDVILKKMNGFKSKDDERNALNFEARLERARQIISRQGR